MQTHFIAGVEIDLEEAAQSAEGWEDNAGGEQCLHSLISASGYP